tara:strand:+ start:275532 stop:275729 length:198 start_codon:yes stop_codon:yes gene_type:complete
MARHDLALYDEFIAEILRYVITGVNHELSQRSRNNHLHQIIQRIEVFQPWKPGWSVTPTAIQKMH